MAEEFEIRPGTVLSVGPGRIVVRLDKEEADCGGCRSCALKSLCHGRESSYIDVPVVVPGGRAPAQGERVEVAYQSASPAKAAVVLFLPALLGLVLGGWVALRFLGGGDWTFLGGTAVGFSAGLAFTYAVNRAFRSIAPKTRLVEEGGL